MESLVGLSPLIDLSLQSHVDIPHFSSQPGIRQVIHIFGALLDLIDDVFVRKFVGVDDTADEPPERALCVPRDSPLKEEYDVGIYPRYCILHHECRVESAIEIDDRENFSNSVERF